MRKKLLALLMCATMVLGSSAVASAAATVTEDNIKDATKVVNQFTSGAIDKEFDAKLSTVTFPVTYTSGTTTAFYSYGIVDADSETPGADKSTTTTVKVNADGKALTKVTGTLSLDVIDDNNNILVVSAGENGNVNAATATNPSVDSTNLSATAAKAVKDSSLYYVTTEFKKAGTTLADNEYVVVADDEYTQFKDTTKPVTIFNTDGSLVVDRKVATLTKYTAEETATTTTKTTIDSYGVDPDGYINLVDSTKDVLKLSKEVVDGYWVSVSKATAALGNVAQALADKEITSSAAAVDINVYKLAANKDADTTTETGMMKLSKVKVDEKGAAVTFKADWLSRSNAKNANVVYVLRSGSTDFEKYFFNFGTVLKVSDFADDSFSTNYVVSGTYIFDYVEDASQNDGVNDEATTTATTAAPAADTAATSPKTGDVAPIAALAVVMMGACGAMVVASKKRA